MRVTWDQLLAIYEEFPFAQHPLWRGVVSGEFSRAQIVLAECQHYFRSRQGRELRTAAMKATRGIADPVVAQSIFETYLDECVDRPGDPSHLDLVVRMISERPAPSDLNKITPTPGNSAAVALYKDIATRGPEMHLISAGVVEHHYAQLCPALFKAYTAPPIDYSSHQAETYRLHSSMDAEHADRARRALDHTLKTVGAGIVTQSVRDALVATSLHYDGMLQAIRETNDFWNGRT